MLLFPGQVTFYQTQAMLRRAPLAYHILPSRGPMFHRVRRFLLGEIMQTLGSRLLLISPFEEISVIFLALAVQVAVSKLYW